jgi:hypothetical protein
MQGVLLLFECALAFFGDVAQAPGTFISTYLTNATMVSNGTINGIQKPFYVGLAAIHNQQIGSSLTASPEIINPTHGGVSFVLLCAATVYDIPYNSVTGTVTKFTATPSNDSTANI